jgi:hypothetical protein
VQQALERLREREFRAGRYNPVTPFINFDRPLPTAAAVAPCATIAEAVRSAGEDGTRSILDIEHVGTRGGVGVAVLVSRELLEEVFCTQTPSHEEVDERKGELFAVLGRGECVYLVVYDAGRPTERLFAGYSYD